MAFPKTQFHAFGVKCTKHKRKGSGQNDLYYTDEIKSRFVRRLKPFPADITVASDFIGGDFLFAIKAERVIKYTGVPNT